MNYDIEIGWIEGNYDGHAEVDEWLTFTDGYEVMDGVADFEPCGATNPDGDLIVCMARKHHEHPHVVCVAQYPDWSTQRVVGVRRRKTASV